MKKEFVTPFMSVIAVDNIDTVTTSPALDMNEQGLELPEIVFPFESN